MPHSPHYNWIKLISSDYSQDLTKVTSKLCQENTINFGLIIPRSQCFDCRCWECGEWGQSVGGESQSEAESRRETPRLSPEPESESPVSCCSSHSGENIISVRETWDPEIHLRVGCGEITGNIDLSHQTAWTKWPGYFVEIFQSYHFLKRSGYLFDGFHQPKTLFSKK